MTTPHNYYPAGINATRRLCELSTDRKWVLFAGDDLWKPVSKYPGRYAELREVDTTADATTAAGVEGVNE